MNDDFKWGSIYPTSLVAKKTHFVLVSNRSPIQCQTVKPINWRLARTIKLSLRSWKWTSRTICLLIACQRNSRIISTTATSITSQCQFDATPFKHHSQSRAKKQHLATEIKRASSARQTTPSLSPFPLAMLKFLSLLLCCIAVASAARAPRIRFGRPVTAGELSSKFKFLVSVYACGRNGMCSACTGSVVSANRVLLAAHCLCGDMSGGIKVRSVDKHVLHRLTLRIAPHFHWHLAVDPNVGLIIMSRSARLMRISAFQCDCHFLFWMVQPHLKSCVGTFQVFFQTLNAGRGSDSTTARVLKQKPFRCDDNRSYQANVDVAVLQLDKATSHPAVQLECSQ